jgi:hypothetical protein
MLSPEVGFGCGALYLSHVKDKLKLLFDFYTDRYIYILMNFVLDPKGRIHGFTKA